LTLNTSPTVVHSQLTDAQARELALWLRLQHRSRAPLGPVPAEFSPLSADNAEHVQAVFVVLKSQEYGDPVGWKIALATPVMQAMVGLDAPIAGRLHAGQVLSSPASIEHHNYLRLLVEFEIAVILGRDLKALPGKPARHYDRNSVALAVEAVAPAMEIADDRRADYRQMGTQGPQLIADNAWNEGGVIGIWRRDWAALGSGSEGLGSLRGEALINDAPVGQGFGRDLMGHPFDALAWLANEAIRRGAHLRKGEIAILGSLVTSKFPERGDHLSFVLDGFAPIHLDVR
jgi:2-keto-4-pentenoate hydratase